MGDNEKVTVMFETSETRKADGTNYDDILLSGPIDIFAIVDNFNGVNGNDPMPTIAEIEKDDLINASNEEEYLRILAERLENYSGTISLYSEAFNKLAYLASKYDTKTIVVFVRDIRGSKVSSGSDDVQDHRGAYFRLEKVIDGECVWQEILLGTHSHDNLKTLDSLGSLELSAEGDDYTVVYNKDKGTFAIKQGCSSINLPELPNFIKKGKEDIQKLNETKDNEPAESSPHHLDADLDELQDTYDWFNYDANTASGTCRDLYLALVKEGKDIYLKRNPKAETNPFERGWLPEITLNKEESYKGICLYMSTQDITFNGDGENNHVIYSPELGTYIIKFPLNRLVNLDSDDVFLFQDENIVRERTNGKNNFKIIEYDKITKILTISLSGKIIDQIKNRESIEFTVLVTHGSKTDSDFRYQFEYIFTNDINKLSLNTIREALMAEYAKAKIFNRPRLPKLFLSTNEDGNLVWDNKFTPAQTFYSAQKALHREKGSDVVIDVATNTIVKVEGNKYVLKFENAFFNPLEDFPILIINELFAFGESIKQDPDVKGGVECRIDVDNHALNSEGDDIITLIIVKSGAGKSLADELASEYISREEAISILSRGKLDLSDYYTKSEIDEKFAKKFHTHGEYALKTHNHDERYANYYHSHPEIILAIAKLIADKDDNLEDVKNRIEEYINGLDGKFKSNLEKIEEALGKITAGDITVPDSAVTALRDLIENYNRTHPGKEKEPLAPGQKLTLDQFLQKLIEVFDIDTITTDQVLLKNSLKVNLINGSVGGIDEDGKIYAAGTTLETILRDMLDPHKSSAYVLKTMKPSQEKSFLKWYLKNDAKKEMEEVNLSDIRTENLGNGENLYFIPFVKNSNGKDCIYTYIKRETNKFESLTLDTEIVYRDGETETVLHGEKFFDDGQSYYRYDYNNPKFETGDILGLILVKYGEKDIPDGYGEKVDGTRLEAGELTFTQKIVINKPDFYYGIFSIPETELSETVLDDMIERKVLDKGYYEDNLHEKEIRLISSPANNIIYILIEDNDNSKGNEKIIDNVTHADISDCFELVDTLGFGKFSKYTLLMYEVFFDDNETIEHDLIIKEGN